MKKLSPEMLLVLMVAAVAVIGIGLLMVNSNFGTSDLSGQAVSGAKTVTKVKTPCTDSDSSSSGTAYMYTKGTVTVTGTSKSSTYTDYCSGDSLVEYYCSSGSARTWTFTCGSGYACEEGACILVSAYPDFTPESVHLAIDSEDKSTTLVAEVKNKGSVEGAIGTYVIEVFWEMDDGTVEKSAGEFTSTDTIHSHATSSVVATSLEVPEQWLEEFNAGSEKTIEVAVALDPYEDVEELDETNNGLTTELTLSEDSKIGDNEFYVY